MRKKILLFVLILFAIQTVSANGGIGYKGIYINNNGTKTWYKAHNVSWSYNGCANFSFNSAADFNGLNLGSLTSTETLQISGFAVVGWTDNSDWVAGKLLYKVWKQVETEPGTWSEISVGNYGNGLGATQVVCSSGNDRVIGYNDGITNLNPGAPGIYNFKVQALGRMQWSGGNFNINDGTEVTATFTITSSTTDNFRTKTTGTWGVPANWESSSNNVNWGTATSYPEWHAASVSVESGHELSCNGAFSASSLTIKPTGKVTITSSPAGTLSITGNLLIQSDVTGTGTFVDKNTSSGYTVNGTTTVQQYLSSYRSWYMSTPLTGTIIPTDNNSANPTLIQSYKETDNTWPAATSSGLTAGIGYMVNPGTTSGASTLTFSGAALNNGPVTVQLSRTTANTANPGFNLIGNPYPSYVNIFKVFDTDNNNIINYNAGNGAVDNDINILPTYWYRTKFSGSWGWDTYNIPSHLSSSAASGLSVTDYIPPMQAFWVRVNTVSTNTPFAFTNLLRTHQDVTGNKFRAPAATSAVNQVLRLQVASGGNTDESVIYFNANASNSFDAYDSPKMMNSATSTMPDIYTTAGSEQLVINGMNNIPYNTDIPLYFRANDSAARIFTIKANEFSNFEQGTQVYIKNNQSGEQELISDGKVYTFDATSQLSDPAFSLIIKAPGAITALPDSDNSHVLVYTNVNRQITVSGSKAGSVIYIYNSTGLQINKKTLQNANTIIDVPAAGVYMVRVGDITRKVVAP